MTLRFREITPTFGLDVEGWSPDDDLDPRSVAQLRDAFDTHGVLRFRGADVDPDAQRYVCGLLVAAESSTGRASAQANAHLYSTRISNRDDDGNAPHGRLLFHSDGMWSDTPQELLSLYGERVEQPSVPTVFVSATRAWARLPDDLRARVEGLTATHMTGQRDRGGFDSAELLRAERSAEASHSTPIERAHHRTGQPILYVSQMMTVAVDGLAPDESEALLEKLFAILYAPDNAFEHDWREGDLVVWDNLAVQHARGMLTPDAPERSLRKVSAPRPSAAARAAKAMPTFARRS